MKPDHFLSRIPSRYWGYMALLLWGAATLFVSRHDPYNLDEGGAKALLLVWSVADQMASAVVTFGTPDLRILLFAPAGFLWTGSVFAAKVCATLALALAAWLLYQWKLREGDAECALIATGLLLISPATVEQVEAFAPGAFLIPAFALGAWLDSAYRARPRPFGGWYFSQLFVAALCVSLHPAGLAYPLVLLWAWYKSPLDKKQQRYFFIGIGAVTLFTLLVRMGWNDTAWLQNPLMSLASIALGTPLNHEMTVAHWIAGGIILALLIFVLFKQFRAIRSDFTGRTLLAGLLLGAVSCDQTWSMVALGLALYYGFPLLLNRPHGADGGLVQQRGAALFLLTALAVIFMTADKGHYEAGRHGVLSDQDQLIRSLSEEAENARQLAEENDGAGHAPPRLRVASQWPSRTMIACRCDTLPLPPVAKDPQAQLAMLHSVNHLLFDPKDPANILLARNFAMLGGGMAETVALQPGGTLLYIRDDSPASSVGSASSVGHADAKGSADSKDE
jgi:hypothetical protein